MKLLCLFRQCRWRYFGNLALADDAPSGLYQCACCKTLSLGAPTDPRTRTPPTPNDQQISPTTKDPK